MEYFPMGMGNISQWAEDHNWPVFMEDSDSSLGSSGGHPGEMIYQPQRMGVIIYGSFICLWTLGVNVMLAAGAWACRKMEKTLDLQNISWKDARLVPGKYLLLTLSVVQMLVAVTVVPFHVKVEAIGGWILGVTPCRIWLVAEVFLFTVSSWCLVMINMDSLVFAVKPLVYYTALRGLKEFTMILSCVTIAFGLCVPITAWMHAPDFVLPEVCATQISPKYSVTLSVAAFFVPVILITISILLFACILCQARDTQRESRGFASYHEMKRVFIVLGVVNLVYVLLWLPAHLSNLIIPFCRGMCVNRHAWALFIWFGLTAPGVLAPLWFINPNLRKHLGGYCCRPREKAHAWISLRGSEESKVDQV